MSAEAGQHAARPRSEVADGLSIVDLTVRFGGHVAVQSTSLVAPAGQVTALIGPNGAGKTTTFNACSGLVRPDSGRINLFGTDITSLSPAERAQRGLGRTYQRMELYDSLSVRENVALGLEARLAGGRFWRHLASTRAEAARIRAATERALDQCGIPSFAARRPSDLSTGQRRLVELARAIAGNFQVLLLDEPSSGLDGPETAAFGRVLRTLAEAGAGILLVEHDMSLVMSISDYCYVLDFGELIFEGTPSVVAESPVVRAAYLGTAA